MKKGITLMEIVIATVIMSIVILGLASIFVATKRHIIHSRSRMAGIEFGKLFLEPLSKAVGQLDWSAGVNDYTNLLEMTTGATPRMGSSQQINRINYTPEYFIEGVDAATDNPDIPGNPLPDVPADSQMRRVILTIQWNEPRP